MTKILLVDDNEPQRKLSRVILEDAGFEVEAVAGALDAVRAARGSRPDVIVSDVMMDNIDGFGLCRRLQDDTLLASIPIVLVSAHYDDASARQLAESLGASALIGRTPDFSAEIKGITICIEQRRGKVRRSRRESYEAHLATNAIQLTKLIDQTRRAELRWKTLFERAHDALTLITPCGVIVEANDRWEDILGIPPSQMIGHHIREFSAPARADDNVAHFRDAVERGGNAQPVELRHASGAAVYMVFSMSTIEIDGVDHVMTIGRDVTAELENERRMVAAESERRLLEERLTHAQRLETIGQLTGGIAHDFNNVLCTILSQAELLVGDLGDHDPRRADAQDILDAAMRATALTKQLLAFSRKQVLELVDVEIGSVVRSVGRMLKRLIGSAIELEIEDGAKLGMVRADVVQLEQVIVNLVVNARDAMPRGGRLSISTSEVAFEGDHELPAGDYVLLAVADTGCGMADAVIDRLFEPFFTTKERGQGTGLGLSTSYGIVKQLGGGIRVISAIGRGTTMKVYLPRLKGTVVSVT